MKVKANIKAQVIHPLVTLFLSSTDYAFIIHQKENIFQVFL